MYTFSLSVLENNSSIISSNYIYIYINRCIFLVRPEIILYNLRNKTIE